MSSPVTSSYRHQLRALGPTDLSDTRLSSRDLVRVLRRARPIRHARNEGVRCGTVAAAPRRGNNSTAARVTTETRTCSARAFARGAGASSRRPHPASPGATYYRSLDERLYAEAKTPAQNTFRFAISGDPCLYTPEVSDTTVQFFRPQGAYRCDARWASAGNVTRVVAGVNDTLSYRWIDETENVVALTPTDPEDPSDFYDIYRLNADLQRGMRANGHFVTTKYAPEDPQYLLRVQFDVRTGRNVVLASVYSLALLSSGDIAFGFFFAEDADAHPTRTWLLAQQQQQQTAAFFFPQLLAPASFVARSFAVQAMGMTPGTAAPASANAENLTSDPQWALPALRAHLPRVSRVTSNTPVIPHFYSNRAFAITGGSVDASLNQFRKQVSNINTAAATLAGTTGFGPALARTLSYQKSMSYPWTQKQRFQDPRALCDVNCKIKLG